LVALTSRATTHKLPNYTDNKTKRKKRQKQKGKRQKQKGKRQKLEIVILTFAFFSFF